MRCRVKLDGWEGPVFEYRIDRSNTWVVTGIGDQFEHWRMIYLPSINPVLRHYPADRPAEKVLLNDLGHDWSRPVERTRANC